MLLYSTFATVSMACLPGHDINNLAEISNNLNLGQPIETHMTEENAFYRSASDESLVSWKICCVPLIVPLLIIGFGKSSTASYFDLG